MDIESISDLVLDKDWLDTYFHTIKVDVYGT